MTPTLFSIRSGTPGRLAIVTRPRGGDWLEDELTGLKNAGIDVLISMLTQEEEEALELTDEGEITRRIGMEFLSCAVQDRTVPDEEWFLSFVRGIRERLVSGRHIAVHCRQSIGRSGVLAASVLVVGGIAADEAWDIVSEGRRCHVPDTQEQRDWVFRLASRL